MMDPCDSRLHRFPRRRVTIAIFLAAVGSWLQHLSAAEIFVLVNDIGMTARFDFYADIASWKDGTPLVPPTWVQPRRHAHVNLPAEGEVAFRYTKVDNTASDTFLWNPGVALADSPETPPRVTFKGIVQKSVTETRVKTVTLAKSVPEQRARTVKITETVSEQRTRTVRRRDPHTGRFVWQEEVCTVKVPRTREVEETYTVMVPVTEQKTVEYRVEVPVAAALFDVGGNEVDPNRWTVRGLV